ncbi:MAG: GAF domain-containing protein [Halobacteriovoraceae bacterium]|nr:GAF domain-containing protein [Halobacteriovoraceae bacterium]
MQPQHIARENPLWFKFALEGLHSISTQELNAEGPDISQILKLGCEIFELEVGLISEIYKDQYRVHLISKNPYGFQNNQIFNLGDTICKRVIKDRKSHLLNNLEEDSELSAHPIHIEKKIKCYLGTPIFVEGKIYGTLSFTSVKVRETPIDDSDKILLELFSKCLGLMLEKSNQNSQRDFFLRKLGHEMRSPLNGILGFCEILNEEVKDPEQKEIFNIIARSSLFLEDRINDLKLFTSLEGESTIGRGNLSLKASFKNLITEYSSLYPEINTWVKNDLPIEEINVLSPRSLMAILRYLLKDCLNRKRDQKEVTISWLSDENCQRIIIDDSGPQPSQDVFDIFENSRYFFSYLKDERLRGLSLDLVMAKLLCDQLEINLRLIPKEKGVVFSVEGIS